MSPTIATTFIPPSLTQHPCWIVPEAVSSGQYVYKKKAAPLFKWMIPEGVWIACQPCIDTPSPQTLVPPISDLSDPLTSCVQKMKMQKRYDLPRKLDTPLSVSICSHNFCYFFASVKADDHHTTHSFFSFPSHSTPTTQINNNGWHQHYRSPVHRVLLQDFRCWTQPTRCSLRTSFLVYI